MTGNLPSDVQLSPKVRRLIKAIEQKIIAHASTMDQAQSGRITFRNGDKGVEVELDTRLK